MKQWLKCYVHNVIIHPLIPFLPKSLGLKLHDRNALWAFGQDAPPKHPYADSTVNGECPVCGSSETLTEMSYLNDEVARLRQVLKQEADYCYAWAANSSLVGDEDRAKRHKDRGDRLSCATIK